MGDIAKFAAVMFIVMGIPLLVVFVFSPFAKAAARRMEGTPGALAGEVDALRAEVDELREGMVRMAELEERLDFAERALAQQREQLRLDAGGPDAAR